MKVADKIREIVKTDEGVVELVNWFICRMSCDNCPPNVHNTKKWQTFLDGKVYGNCPGNCIGSECEHSVRLFLETEC